MDKRTVQNPSQKINTFFYTEKQLKHLAQSCPRRGEWERQKVVTCREPLTAVTSLLALPASYYTRGPTPLFNTTLITSIKYSLFTTP